MAESAAFVRRGFKGGAKASTIAAGIAQGATSFAGADLSTWAGAAANGPARLKFNAGQSDEEIAEFATLSGNAISGLTRGVDGTTDQEHAPGCTITLVSTARDFNEANEAVAKTLGLVSVANALKVYRVNAAGDDIEVAVTGFVGAKANHSTTQSLNNTTFTTLSFDSETFDTNTFHDLVTNNSRFTIPSAKGGKFLLRASVEFAANGTGARHVVIRKNGTNAAYVSSGNAGGSDATVVVCSAVLSAVATDYFDVQAYQSSGGALNVNSNTDTDKRHFFEIAYLGA